MTTYNTYQEAKIANPESEIYKLERNGLFAHCGYHKAELVRFVEFDSAGVKCNPADHCMTVEEFLADGHKFVEGDVLLTNDKSSVQVVGRDYDRDDMSVDTCNTPMSDIDCDVLILRAAALEEKVKMDNSIKYVARKQFDEILKMKPISQKPSTKVEYVKCEFEHAWEALKSFEEGEELYRDKNQTLQTEVVEFVKAASIGGIGYILTYYKADNLYRRIETPMTEQDCFIQDCRKSTMVQDDVVAMSLFEAGCRFVN